MDAILCRTGANKEVLKKKLFHHPSTVRALALTARSIGVYGLTVPQRFTAPLLVVWNITQACNLRCQHCYQNATARPDSTELSTSEKLKVVDELASELVPFLAIAGGEPLMSPDLLDLIAHCQERCIHVTMATNGTLLTPEKCRELRRAGVRYIEVSIDSLDPEEHDRFRGRPGAFNRSVEGIRNAIDAGIRTSLACCFTRQNVHMAERMVQFAIDLGCSTFSHFNFIPVGRGRQVMEYDLLPEQREHLLSILRRFLVEGKISIISTAPQFGRKCIIAGFEDGVFATGHAGHGRGGKTMVLTRYLGGCGAGRCYCSIQPDGAVTPCVYMPDLKMGNLRTQSLSNIWNNRLVDVLADRDDRGDRHAALAG
jgi:MoaA/NifB/PqqE/SkfB family radical SAM enzyme